MTPLKLTGAQVNGDKVTCTGEQIAAVLSTLRALPALAECEWYAGALDGYGLRIPEFEEALLKPVSNMLDLIEQIGSVRQLLDGIFVALPRADGPIIGDCHVTADGPEGWVISNSTVELHAFDTTWIEIYSHDETLLGVLEAQFNSVGPDREGLAQGDAGTYLGRVERIR